MKGERRGALLVIGVLVVSAVLGGIYGPSVRATSSDVNNLQDSVKTFTRVLSVVEKNYATPVDTDHALYSGAIPGMLRVLDPHSSFFDPRAYANLREDQRGRYYGVGHDDCPARQLHLCSGSDAGSSCVSRGHSSRRRDHGRGWQVRRRAQQFGSCGHAEGSQGHDRAYHHEARGIRRPTQFHRDARRNSQAFRGYRLST